VASLLHNLHANFSGGRMLTLGNLAFEPVGIYEKCNQYMTKDRGWFKGNADVSHAPAGLTRLAGVPYQIVDFRTSPVPSCIMLGGPQAKGDLPQEVTGIPVGRKANCLFLLHTYQRAQTWRPAANNTVPPPVFVYVVHYADGGVETVPVRYESGAGNWLMDEPQGLAEAALAWAARPAGQEEGPHAALFSFQWRNPRPEVAIESVDMKYDAQAGSRWGTPALLAITAATEVE
jgi:hypothetical protein